MSQLNPFFGQFGGQFVPEALVPALKELEEAFCQAQNDPAFKAELHELLTQYAGRPTPLTLCRNLTRGTRTKIYLKREDLLHGGAHKTNQVLGQALLARRMGKKRIIAETGAGQHGVASATACALLGLECVVYMGKTDVERQRINVQKMEMLGAKVIPVTSGNMTLKDATNEAIRDWCCHPADTYYIIGSTVGPHPYPDMVARLQSVISREIRVQLQEHEGRDYPNYLIACVGGGSNAAGTIYHYLDDERVKIVLAEAGGLDMPTAEEASKKVRCQFIRTKNGYCYEIEFPQRYLEPFQLKAGSQAGFCLFLHDKDSLADKTGGKGLTITSERGKPADRSPHLWPRMILK